MFGRSWRIATVAGIPVNVDSSWIWIAVLMTYLLWAELQEVGLALFAAVLFFGSVFLHELAHAIAARANGIRVLGITLVVFGGFTSAQSDDKGPGPAFLISAVGPGTSAALGAAFLLLSGTTAGPTHVMLRWIGVLNLIMAGLNVLPGLPLDGGRMLEAVVWRLTGDHRRATTAAARAGVVVGALLIAAGLGLGANVLRIGPLDQNAGLWLAIVGMFVFLGARGSEQQTGIRERLANGTAADAMDPPPPVIPADMTLSEALDRFLRGHEDEGFPVVEAGRVIGMLSFHSAREVGMNDPLRPVRDGLIPLSHVLTADAEEPLESVAARLGTGRTALVLRNGELVGVIGGSALARWARARR